MCDIKTTEILVSQERQRSCSYQCWRNTEPQNRFHSFVEVYLYTTKTLRVRKQSNCRIRILKAKKKKKKEVSIKAY